MTLSNASVTLQLYCTKNHEKKQGYCDEICNRYLYFDDDLREFISVAKIHISFTTKPPDSEKEEDGVSAAAAEEEIWEGTATQRGRERGAAKERERAALTD